MEESYCKKCKKYKKIDQFYRSSYSQCKKCRKAVTKNNQFNKKEVLSMMENIYNKMNAMECLYKEILNKNNNIIDSVLIFIDKMEYNNISKTDELINSINKIDEYNKNINQKIESIAKIGKSKIIIDDEYERNLKNILED